LTQLNNRIVLYKRFSLSVPGRLPEVIQELDAIVSAIEARDPQRAAELSEVHILNAERTVLRRLSSETELPPKDEAETIPSQM
jgi:DNA-binding GntR family transcriptional regulator